MSESKYAGDRRVYLLLGGTAIIPTAEGHESEGDWHIVPPEDSSTGFVVENDVQGPITEGGDKYNQRRKVFATLDEAIYAVIGDPQ
jgi:hypothetical protein